MKYGNNTSLFNATLPAAHSLIWLVVLILFFLITHSANAEDLVLDCRDGNGQTSSWIGKISSDPVFMTDKIVNKRITIRISDDQCLIDHGDYVSNHTLVKKQTDSIECEKKEEIRRENKDKDLNVWSIRINRMNGLLNYSYSRTGFFPSIDFRVTVMSSSTYSCKAASRLF